MGWRGTYRLAAANINDVAANNIVHTAGANIANIAGDEFVVNADDVTLAGLGAAPHLMTLSHANKVLVSTPQYEVMCLGTIVETAGSITLNGVIILNGSPLIPNGLLDTVKLGTTNFTVDPVAPAAPADGDVWIDTSATTPADWRPKLKKYNGVTHAWAEGTITPSNDLTLVDGQWAACNIEPGGPIRLFSNGAGNATLMGSTDGDVQIYNVGSCWLGMTGDTVEIDGDIINMVPAVAFQVGGIGLFVQDAAPIANAVGDCWLDLTAKLVKRWSGAAWV